MSLRTSFECNICKQIFDDPADVTGYSVGPEGVKEMHSPEAGEAHICNSCLGEITHADDE